MGVEGWILALMVLGVPGSVALFAWAALQTQPRCICFRPVWIVLLEGSNDEDEERDDWGGGGRRPPEPRVPSGDASRPPRPRDGCECRRRVAGEQALRHAAPERERGKQG